MSIAGQERRTETGAAGMKIHSPSSAVCMSYEEKEKVGNAKQEEHALDRKSVV